jgi:plastocyanin
MEMSLKINLLALAAVMALPFGGEANAATTNVTYMNFAFSPKDIAINAGDTVIWKNLGGTHTVTGDSPAQPLCGCSGTSIPGFTNTFIFTGDFAYHCSFHGGSPFFMTGIVHVVSTPATPALLTNARSFTNGTFVFTAISTAFHTNIVQASTNLTDSASWIPLMTNYPVTNIFNFTNSNAVQFRNRYYRVVQP